MSIGLLRLGLAFASVASFAAATDGADPLTSPYAWRQEVVGTAVAGGLYRIRIPGSLFDGCLAFPQDVRLVDAEGTQWPFFIRAMAPRVERARCVVESLNLSTVEQEPRHLRLDLRVSPSPGASGPFRHDRVTLVLDGGVYFRRVEVYGSDDRTSWARMGSGYVVEQAGGGADNRDIQYPVSDYPFLQLRIYPDARSGAEAPPREVAVSYRTTRDGERETWPLVFLDVPAREKAAGVQTLWLDAGARHRPLARLRFRTEDGPFARRVRLYGRDSETNAWCRVADGALHRLADCEQDVLEVSGAAFRYWRADLYHYDDPPRRILGVEAEAVSRYLVCEARGAGPAWIYFGAERATPPRFDLEQRRGGEPFVGLPTLALGERAPNPWHGHEGGGRHGRWIAIASVAFTSLLTMGVVIGMIRHRPA